MILYQLLTGNLPFEGPVLALLGKILTEEAPPPSRFRADLDPDLDAICLKAMAREAGDRYGSMAELASALTRHLRAQLETPRMPAGVGPAAESGPRPDGDACATLRPERPFGGLGTPPPPMAALTPDPRADERAVERKRPSLAGRSFYAAVGGAVLLALLMMGYAVVEEWSHGVITVTFSEPGAAVDVVLDGKPLARGGLNEPIRLRTGEHHLWVASSAHQPWSRTFSVHHGTNPTLDVTLMRIAPTRAAGPPSPPTQSRPVPPKPKEVVKNESESKKEAPATVVPKDVVKKESEPTKVRPAPILPTDRPVANTEPSRATPDVSKPAMDRVGTIIPLEATRPGQERDDNGLKMAFCWCPPGTFLMGSPKDDPQRDDDEGNENGPVSVTLNRGFWIGKFEVTQAQWHSVMGTTLRAQRDRADPQSDLYGEGLDRPIYYVNHHEATEFGRRFTESERRAGRLPLGWEYRLPWEAEWEYACRAGTTTRYSFGDDEASLGEYAWFAGNSDWMTRPVGQKRPNQWGLRDMQGNVWEWCADGYDSTLVGGIVPRGPDRALRRVLRGGGWNGLPHLARSANRDGGGPEKRDYNLGFRLVRGTAEIGPGPSIKAPVRRSPSRQPEEDTSKESEPKKVAPAPVGDPEYLTTRVGGIKLKRIAAGEFLMGSPEGEGEADGHPRHRVRITRPFYLGIYEVTHAQYQAVMGVNSSWCAPIMIGPGRRAVRAIFEDANSYGASAKRRDTPSDRGSTRGKFSGRDPRVGT